MKKVLLLLLFPLLSCPAFSQLKKLTTTGLISDCMQVKEIGTERKMALWVPTVFWEMVGEQMQADPEVLKIVSKEMDGYLFFAVVDYRIIPGGATFVPENKILASLRFTDSSGRSLKPVPRTSLSPTVQAMLQGMEPAMAKVFGQFGDGMVMVFFKAPALGSSIAYDLTRPNQFSLSWDDNKLNWQLPLASTLPLKRCPVDQADMQGNWNYCPFHGKKLEAQ